MGGPKTYAEPVKDEEKSSPETEVNESKETETVASETESTVPETEASVE